MEALPDEVKVLGPEGVKAVMKVVDYLQQRGGDSPVIANGRLTLTSGTPITTNNVTASTTGYYTPYNGNKIALYNGVNWQLLNFSEISVQVPSNTNTPFDIFAYNNSGTIALEATAWTNDTTRATGLTTQDGVYVKSGATTRRYLGTGRTTSASGQTEDSTTRRFLWNYYNRVPRSLYGKLPTNTWTYNSTASWRAIAGNTTDGEARIAWVQGVAAEVKINTYGMVDTNTLQPVISVGVDTTGGETSTSIRHQPATASTRHWLSAYHYSTQAAGGHFATTTELATGAGTNYTGYGQNLFHLIEMMFFG